MKGITRGLQLMASVIFALIAAFDTDPASPNTKAILNIMRLWILETCQVGTDVVKLNIWQLVTSDPWKGSRVAFQTWQAQQSLGERKVMVR